jgi:hypothetical protein
MLISLPLGVWLWERLFPDEANGKDAVIVVQLQWRTLKVFECRLTQRCRNIFDGGWQIGNHVIDWLGWFWLWVGVGV